MTGNHSPAPNERMRTMTAEQITILMRSKIRTWGWMYR